MTKDPVCGMNVDEKKSAKADHMGKTFYFCGPGCKSAFEKNPARYAGAASRPQSAQGHGGHH